MTSCHSVTNLGLVDMFGVYSRKDPQRVATVGVVSFIV